MITNVVVALSIVLSVLFATAWWALPGFRAWLEQPKHRFQEQVRRYDRERSHEGGAPGGRGT